MGVLTSHLALQVGHFACFHKLSVIHVMLHYSLGWGGVTLIGALWQRYQGLLLMVLSSRFTFYCVYNVIKKCIIV